MKLVEPFMDTFRMYFEPKEVDWVGRGGKNGQRDGQKTSRTYGFGALPRPLNG